MSINGSMYAGISGLSVHSSAMSVIGNNLANASTVGYKSATAQFEDVFYSTINTANGLSQVGHGATVSSIYQNFSQGSYQSSSESTNVAIGGDGFFMVQDPGTKSMYYTRAGNFTFDQYGYLVNPQGCRVQGWDARTNTDDGTVDTVGALGSLRLDTYQSPPSATEEVSLYLNLDRDADDNATDTTNPFFAMLGQWDGQDEDEALGDSQYEYQNTITVYDEAGSAHELTVYFDKVEDAAVASGAGSNDVWEYIVTCDPSEDGRTIDGNSLADTSAAGLLMAGTIEFNSSGIMTGLSAFTLPSSATGDMKDLSNWVPADFDEDGYPVFTANFSGADNANGTDEANAQTISLDLGIRNNQLTGTGWDASAPANAAALGSNYANLFTFNDVKTDANAATSYEQASTTLDQSQDGFAAGFLQSISIDSDGVVSGTYSNGKIHDLFVLGLADFNNPQGLILEGGSLYSKGSDSGEAVTGRANTSTYGSIESNSLEQSNVDMSTEMVRLITTQRGYQANSKVITTADSMLQEAINLKR